MSTRPDHRTIGRMSDEALELIVDSYSGCDASPDEEATVELAQRELDARELWNSDDDRIRESVGNYGH